MAPRRSPGELEQEVLACLAAAPGPMSPSDVQAEMPGALAYTTVMTTLARLYAKRALTREQRGRGYVYSLPEDAGTARASMAAFHMQRLLDHEDDRAGVLAQFVAQLEAEDEALLQRLLRRGGKPGPTPS